MRITIDPQSLSKKENYLLQISLIIPRPIGWVSTRSREGKDNLAPFSFFNGLASHPPVVMISVGEHQDRYKDTAKNIYETGEFAVQGVMDAHAKAMADTAKITDPDIDEFVQVGLTKEPAKTIQVSLVAGSPWAMECHLLQAHKLYQNHIFYGKVVCYHVEKSLLNNGQMDPSKITMVGRLGYKQYTMVNAQTLRREEDL